MIKKILGILLVASPLIIMFVALVLSTEWLFALFVIGTTILVASIFIGLVLLGVHLLTD